MTGFAAYLLDVVVDLAAQLLKRGPYAEPELYPEYDELR